MLHYVFIRKLSQKENESGDEGLYIALSTNHCKQKYNSNF